MSPVLTCDLLALAAGWWAAWRVVRRSLPAQNVLAIAALALGISASAHAYTLLIAVQPIPWMWHIPAALGVGLIMVASRALARRMGGWFAQKRPLAAYVLAIPIIFSLSAMLPPGHSPKGFHAVWTLAMLVYQLVVTPWWIRKSPVLEEHDSKASWLWMAISCYIGLRTCVSGAPFFGSITLAAGVIAGAVAARARDRALNLSGGAE